LLAHLQAWRFHNSRRVRPKHLFHETCYCFFGVSLAKVIGPPTKAVRYRQVTRDYGKQGWMKSWDRVAVEQIEKKRNKEK